MNLLREAEQRKQNSDGHMNEVQGLLTELLDALQAATQAIVEGRENSV